MNQICAPRVVIIGAGGFVGTHLVSILHAALGCDAVVALSRDDLDVCDGIAVDDMLMHHAPTHLVNLAGLAAPAAAMRAGHAAWALHATAAEDLGRRMLACMPEAWLIHVGSGLAYGRTALHGQPVTEVELMDPIDTYGKSKAAGDIALGELAKEGLRVVRMRPFNHTGAGQTVDFVVPAFAAQIARIEVGRQAPVLDVGNLDAARDFLHVTDVAEAYRAVIDTTLAAPKAIAPGTAFNIASGQSVVIHDILNRLCALSDVEIEIQADSARQRPSDLPCLLGNAAALTQATGWLPRKSVDDALHDVLSAQRSTA